MCCYNTYCAQNANFNAENLAVWNGTATFVSLNIIKGGENR